MGDTINPMNFDAFSGAFFVDRLALIDGSLSPRLEDCQTSTQTKRCSFAHVSLHDDGSGFTNLIESTNTNQADPRTSGWAQGWAGHLFYLGEGTPKLLNARTTITQPTPFATRPRDVRSPRSQKHFQEKLVGARALSRCSLLNRRPDEWRTRIRGYKNTSRRPNWWMTPSTTCKKGMTAFVTEPTRPVSRRRCGVR